MPDTGSLALSFAFVAFGVSIILFPGGLRKTMDTFNKNVIQLEVDLDRNRPMRYLLGLVTIALGCVLFRVALFFR